LFELGVIFFLNLEVHSVTAMICWPIYCTKRTALVCYYYHVGFL